VSSRPEQLRGEGRLTRDRKTYRTLKHAQAVCNYLNEFGWHHDRYRWEPSPRDDGLFELLRFER
jgi:hypothetical protein